MDPRKSAREYTLDLFAADTSSVRDITRGVLHMIFFHRYFPLIRPGTIDVLDLTLPCVSIPEVEAAIDSRAYQLSRQLSSAGAGGSGAGSPSGGRGHLQIKFLDKRRKSKKAERSSSGGGGGGVGGGLAWFGLGGGGVGTRHHGDEDVCWETWDIKVTLAAPRTETERQKAVRAMETTLQRTALKIMAIANEDKEHIPAITNESPFPYQINLNPRFEARGIR